MNTNMLSYLITSPGVRINSFFKDLTAKLLFLNIIILGPVFCLKITECMTIFPCSGKLNWFQVLWASMVASG
jgi:hypothetical protein